MDRFDQAGGAHPAGTGSAARLDPCVSSFRAPPACVLAAGRPKPRRGYGLLKGRRTRFQQKRRTGRLTASTPVHRGEREIIARN